MDKLGLKETPILDDLQIKDLKKHFEGQSVDYLKTALKQIEDDSEKDQGPYKNGGIPSNVNKIYNLIQDVIEQKTDKI